MFASSTHSTVHLSWKNHFLSVIKIVLVSIAMTFSLWPLLVMLLTWKSQFIHCELFWIRESATCQKWILTIQVCEADGDVTVSLWAVFPFWCLSFRPQALVNWGKKSKYYFQMKCHKYIFDGEILTWLKLSCVNVVDNTNFINEEHPKNKRTPYASLKYFSELHIREHSLVVFSNPVLYQWFASLHFVIFSSQTVAVREDVLFSVSILRANYLTVHKVADLSKLWSCRVISLWASLFSETTEIPQCPSRWPSLLWGRTCL